MDDSLDWTLLRRYADRDCTAAESATVEAWLVAYPEWRAEVDAIRSLNATVHALGPTADLPASWRRLSGQIGLSSREADALADRATGLAPASHFSTSSLRERTPPVASPPRSWPRGVGEEGWAGWVRKGRAGQRPAPTWIAVAVVITVGTGLAVGSLRHHAAVASRGRAYATAAGQRLSVTLVDGTQLILAPASTVRIAADYGRGSGSRQVEIEGEAFFTVVHDPARPFTVRVTNAVATDVGTQFDVRAYAEDHAVRVAVTDGSVALVARPPRAARSALAAGDVATLDGSGTLTVTHGRDVAALLAWRQGGLVFDNAPLHEVVRELARAFDLDITVADSTLLANRITSSFGEAPATEVLDAISFAVGASYTRSGRHVVFRRRVGAADGSVPIQPGTATLTARVVD